MRGGVGEYKLLKTTHLYKLRILLKNTCFVTKDIS